MSPLIIGIVAVVVLSLAAATWRRPRLTSVTVWALVASIFFCSALLLTLPGEFKDVARWITFSVPFIWVAFQFYCYWDKKDWRVAANLIAISIVSGMVVFVTEPNI